jgi:hypothetical protein
MTDPERCVAMIRNERCGATREGVIHRTEFRGAWFKGWTPFTGHAFVPPEGEP